MAPLQDSIHKDAPSTLPAIKQRPGQTINNLKDDKL